MQSVVRLSLLVLVVSAIGTSCKKPAPSQAKHIPKAASFVVAIDMKQMQDKLSKNQEIIENILRSGDSADVNKGKQEWEDLKQSGVDFSEPVYISMINKGTNDKVSAATAVVKDEGKFEAYIKKKVAGAEVKKGKGFSYVTKDKDKVIGWNKELVIAMSADNSLPAFQDSTEPGANLGRPQSSEGELTAEADSYFNMKEDESVAAIPEFRDMLQDKGDINVWMNSSTSIADIPLPLPKIKELLANNYTAATLKFEDGKIVADSKSYYSKELLDLLKKYPSATADLGLVENYPSDNINGFAVMNINPQFFNGLLQNMEMGAMADDFLTKAAGTKFTVQDLLKSFKGDFALIVSDFSMPASDSTQLKRPINGKPPMKILFNASIGDRAELNRMLDVLVQKQMLVKDASGYSLDPRMRQAGMQMSLDDKSLIFSTDETLLNKYKAKTKKASLPKDVTSDLSGKTAAFYVNIESFANGAASVGGPGAKQAMAKAKETFKDFKGYAGKSSGNHYEGHFELRLKNDKENSLTSILRMIEGVSKDARIAKDSAGVPVTSL